MSNLNAFKTKQTNDKFIWMSIGQQQFPTNNPYKITMGHEENFVINLVSGSIQIQNILDHIKTHIPCWIGVPVVWDFSNAKLDNLSAHELAKLPQHLSLLSQLREGEKTAVVVLGDSNLWMLRQYWISSSINSAIIDMSFFNTLNDAKAWVSHS